MNTKFKVVSAMLAVLVLLSVLCISAYADERESTPSFSARITRTLESPSMLMEEMVCGDMARALDSAGLSL